MPRRRKHQRNSGKPDVAPGEEVGRLEKVAPTGRMRRSGRVEKGSDSRLEKSPQRPEVGDSHREVHT